MEWKARLSAPQEHRPPLRAARHISRVEHLGVSSEELLASGAILRAHRYRCGRLLWRVEARRSDSDRIGNLRLDSTRPVDGRCGILYSAYYFVRREWSGGGTPERFVLHSTR